MPLVYGQDERVTTWVAARMGQAEPPPAYASIGYERNGELVAGVYFDGMSETNIFAHIASDGSPLPQDLLTAVCVFAYETLDCRRMTFMVYDSNQPVIRFINALGAEYEARLKWAHAGGDVLIYVLWRDGSFYRRLLETGRVNRVGAET